MYTHTCTQTHAYIDTYTKTHTHSHTCTHTPIHTYTHIHAIVTHLIQVPWRYECLGRRWQNDVIETKAQLRFLLHHSDTSYESIYTLKTPCMRCLTVLEGCVVYRLLTWARGLLAGVSSPLLNVEGTSKPTSHCAQIYLIKFLRTLLVKDA